MCPGLLTRHRDRPAPDDLRRALQGGGLRRTDSSYAARYDRVRRVGQLDHKQPHQGVSVFSLKGGGYDKDTRAIHGHHGTGAADGRACDGSSRDGEATAKLTGDAEVPGPGDPKSSGTVQVTLNPTKGEVCYELSVANIEEATAAHIHAG